MKNYDCKMIYSNADGVGGCNYVQAKICEHNRDVNILLLAAE